MNGNRLILIISLCSLLLILPISANSGHSGGPDDFGYTYADSKLSGGPTYNWIEISGNGTKILNSSDDNYIANISLGFFFNYYGTDYSNVAISNNGLVFSGLGSTQYVNQPIKNSSLVHGFIAPYWDDLVTWGSGDAAIYYKTLGAAPNRMFIAEWKDNPHYVSSTSNVTFESILYEGTNNIEFQYQDTDFGNVSGAVYSDDPPYDNGGSATVGIESPSGIDGLQYSYNEQVIEPGLAIMIKFPTFSGTNMHLSKNAPPSINRGSSLMYTLFFNNFGNTTASNVVLTDTLPAEVEYVSASDSGIYEPVTRKVSWNIGSVTAFPHGGGFETVNVLVPNSVTIGTVIQNTASINTSTLETRYDDNNATSSTLITGLSLPPGVNVAPIVGNQAGTPTIYWHTPIIFSYASCPNATGVDIRINIDDGGPNITGSMTGGPPDWNYTTTFYPRHGSALITYTIYGCDVQNVTFPIYIDPAGFIYDLSTGQRIPGASVWLQWPDANGNWINVPTGLTPAAMQPDQNPLTTNSDGQYQWDVINGSYRIHVEAAGYQSANSNSVNIPPPVYDLDVGLTPLGPAPVSVTNLINSTYLPSSISWTWIDPSDSNFDHVAVYLNGIFKGNITKGTQTYTATGLNSSTSFTIATHTVGTTGLINQTWVNDTAWTAPVIKPLPNGDIPTSPDHNGLYTDLNGNGRNDFNDVVLYFQNMQWMENNEPIQCFDYNGNGRIDFNDIITLFKEIG